MQHQFPLYPPPTCPECGQPGDLLRVKRGNPNGNEGRPYYNCAKGHRSVWLTWDDSEGISNQNPPCRCAGRYCMRLERRNDGAQYFRCATKTCGHTQDYFPTSAAPSTQSGSIYSGMSSTSMTTAPMPMNQMLVAPPQYQVAAPSTTAPSFTGGKPVASTTTNSLAADLENGQLYGSRNYEKHDRRCCIVM